MEINQIVTNAMQTDDLEDRIERLADGAEMFHKESPDDRRMSESVARFVSTHVVGNSEMAGAMDMEELAEQIRLFAREYDGFSQFNPDEDLITYVGAPSDFTRADRQVEMIVTGLYHHAISKELDMDQVATVTFHAQEWQTYHGEEVAVDTDQTATYTVPLESVTDGGGNLPSDDTYESDRLRTHDNAPDWVRNWEGPFYITIDDAG